MLQQHTATVLPRFLSCSPRKHPSPLSSLLFHLQAQQQFSTGDHSLWAGRRNLYVQSPVTDNNPVGVRVLNILYPWSISRAQLVLRRWASSCCPCRELQTAQRVSNLPGMQDEVECREGLKIYGHWPMSE